MPGYPCVWAERLLQRRMARYRTERLVEWLCQRGMVHDCVWHACSYSTLMACHSPSSAFASEPIRTTQLRRRVAECITERAAGWVCKRGMFHACAWHTFP